MTRRTHTVAAAVALSLAATMLPSAPAMTRPAAPVAWEPPEPDDLIPVDGVEDASWHLEPTWSAGEAEVRGTTDVEWPAAVTATVPLDPPAGTTGAEADAAAEEVPGSQVGDLPVWVAPAPRRPGQPAPAPEATPAAVTVEVHEPDAAGEAGVLGVLVDVGRADGVWSDGATELTVGYGDFASAAGGDWASRLRLVRLPACSLTTPEVARCTAAVPLASRNDAEARTVTAVAPLAASGEATVLALTAGPAGDNGDYKATSLTPASTWDVSTHTGAFTWSLPMRTVPAVGGPTPTLGLSYSSQTMDGRTSGNNTQGSWAGDGFDLWPGYIERSYRSCSEDTAAVDGQTPNNQGKPTGDQCWWRQNATLSLNGRSTELVDAGGGLWRGVSDDGSRLELLTGAANGDENGEHWKLTTKDGTQYWFGRQTGPGGASGTSPTSSTWTTEVYGNHPGDPGHASAFASSRRAQAWRWNLDYVVDPHGNTMTLFYGKETGAYGRENDPSKRTTYDRGGYLTRIEYSNRSDAPAGTHAGARVVFEVQDRCKPGATCLDGSGRPVAASYPDTPFDQFCWAAPCTTQLSPTFWTQKRLAKVTTEVHTGGGAYGKVDSWSLRHEWLDAGVMKGEGVPMFLRGVTHTGHVTSAGGTEATDPEIVFDPGAEPLANRVDDPNDNRTELKRWRVKRVTTETGAQVFVEYAPPQCQRSALPAPHANDKLCYPQLYSADGSTPTLDWFHKYVVARITANDNAAGSTPQVTNYEYVGAPAWHFDESELVKEEKRTWSQFRGFERVRVRAGAESGPRVLTEERFLRGMDGDRQPAGTPARDVWVTDSWGNRIEDHEAFAGRSLEATTFESDGGPWLSGRLTRPTTPVRTAVAGILEAWMVDTGTTRAYTRTTAEADGVRWARTDTRYNADGLPTEVDDLGDESTPADDRCIRTWYARNEALGLVDRAKRTETVGVACSATPVLPADMVASTRTTYDDPAAGLDTQVPSRGLPVKVEEIDGWSGTTAQWATTATKAYDRNGRVTSSADARGYATTTVYTPALAGPLTRTVERNPLGHPTTTDYATAWNVPRTILDPNDGITSLDYDGMGRLRKVWLPGRASPAVADLEFAYEVRNDAPTAVTTRTLLPSGSGHRTSVALFDGWLRERQVQTQAPGGGRTITETHYGSRGETTWTAAAYFDASSGPDTTLARTSRSAIPSVTERTYDAAGRLTAEALHGPDGELWRTTTGYVGDLTVVTPPEGGTRTATRVDARGQTVEIRRYHARTGDVASGFDATVTTYTDAGRPETVTDPAGNVWRHFYDQRGREVRREDPDEGVTLATYDAAGNRLTSTDARGATLATAYDPLGRREALRSGSATGPLRARWFYDTLPRGLGRLTRSERIEGDRTYVAAVAGYDAAGRTTGTSLTIPAAEGALCAAGGSTPCTFTTTTTYKADGQPASTVLPRVGNLAAEQLTQSYNDVGDPTTISASAGPLMRSVHYDKVGRITQRVLGEVGRQMSHDVALDDTTGRRTEGSVALEGRATPLDMAYRYDPAGNLTRIHDTPFGQPTDTQCYGYDHLRRLVEAWTPENGDCGPAPDVDDLGGPAAYWHSYRYEGAAGLTGSRTTETWHATGGETVRRYAYPDQAGATGSRPHGLDRVTTDHPVLADTADDYTYDAAGNTATRVDAAGTTRFEWDPEGNIAAMVAPDGRRTSYVYDADGERLLRRDPGGTGTTLYLGNGQEVAVAPGSTTAVGTRYYQHAGETIAVRTQAAGLSFVAGDHHDTGELAVKASDLSVTRRRTLPFGGSRGGAPAGWPGDKGFVGGTKDPHGLVHLGARLYDPATGRFASVDPEIDQTDPQQMHGYSYAGNAPTVFADPTGRMYPPGDVGGGGSSGSTTTCTGTPDRCADQRGLNDTGSSTPTGTGGTEGGGRGRGGRGPGGGRPGARLVPGSTFQATPGFPGPDPDGIFCRVNEFGCWLGGKVNELWNMESEYDWGTAAAAAFNLWAGYNEVQAGIGLMSSSAGGVVVVAGRGGPGAAAAAAPASGAKFIGGLIAVAFGTATLSEGMDQMSDFARNPRATEEEGRTVGDNVGRFITGISPDKILTNQLNKLNRLLQGGS